MGVQKIKYTWSDSTESIAYEVAQTGAVMVKLDATIAGDSSNVPYALTIVKDSLKSLYIAASQGTTLAIGGNNEVQLLTPSGAGVGDTFELIFDGEDTDQIPFDSDGAVIETALQALPNIGPGNVSVTGAVGGPWTVEFVGELGLSNQPGITTGTISAGASLAVTTPTPGVAPAQTIELVAGLPLQWQLDGYFDNPLDQDVSTLTLTVSGAATSQVRLRALYG